ncbi:MAG: Rieske 2Fe-2S domain-containing protein [Verrucomicrobia bacterium]|nr:Rieske 2Fe-2S domain-containing protein [Verrucomicrobiota bacterium]
MSEWINAGTTGELKPGEAKVIAAGEREIAIFNVDGKFHAIDNLCPHRGGPLGDGVLEGNVVVCPWHGWRFDVTTGKSPVMPLVSVEQFDIAVEGDNVKVKVD